MSVKPLRFNISFLRGSWLGSDPDTSKRHAFRQISAPSVSPRTVCVKMPDHGPRPLASPYLSFCKTQPLNA